MKTTLDIPNHILHRAKARAALQGLSLRKYVSLPLEHHAHASSPSDADTPPWMGGFGELADLMDETLRIDARVVAAFSAIGCMSNV